MPFKKLSLNSIADKAQEVAEQARKKIEAAQQESAKEGGPTSLLGKTVQAHQKLEDKVQEVNKKVGDAAGKKLNEITGNDQAADKVAAGMKKVDDAAIKARAGLKKASNQVAEATAGKITDVTGRETTAREVKTAAILAGLAIGATQILDGAVEGMVDGVGVEGMDATGIDSVSVEGGAEVASADASTGFDGPAQSFEEETHKFFADKGGLNIKTDVVDMDGCVLDSGA